MIRRPIAGLAILVLVLAGAVVWAQARSSGDAPRTIEPSAIEPSDIEPSDIGPSGVEHRVSGSFTESLGAGAHVLLLEVPVVPDVGAVPFGSSPFLALEELTIVAPDGTSILARTDRTQSALGGSYLSAVRFEVAEPGDHRFDVVTSEATRALVQRAAGE